MLAGFPPGPYITLTVRDTGPGMSDETRDRIFEPFFTTKEGGRGMGLAATYGIVAHHGGRITVESAEGEGTTFVVHLPATTAQPAPRVATAAGPPAGADGITVLLVDDEVAILSATRRLLQRQGYTVLTAESGAEALQLAGHATTPIHVVLLDLRMPGMSGADVFDPLAALRPEARIVVCSGYDLDVHAQALLDRGAAAFVRKPFRLEDIEAVIARVLHRTA
jgi:CheY-like chemotaxis protein